MTQRNVTIMIIDDEPSIRNMVKVFLEGLNYSIEECKEGKQAICLIPSIKPDLILLDLGLPDLDGKDVLTAIRTWSQIPIIILSAREEDKEIVNALNIGANDYIVKPFNPAVLLARINANLRQQVNVINTEPTITNGPIRMDMVRHEVFIHDKQIFLTPKEFELMRFFIVHRGKTLTNRQILKSVWSSEHMEDNPYVRVHVGQLRKKIATCDVSRELIKNEPGIGYRMEVVDLLEAA